MAASSLRDALFQRSLEDLIKGIRLYGESSFLPRAMEEIKREIESTDPQTKSAALQKLSYLTSIYGHDISWAFSHVVQVMSRPCFSHKRIGYHAASLSFNDSAPCFFLITNQLRMDLKSANEFEVSLALECVSRVGSAEFVRNLAPEMFTLLGSSKISVRKKGIAVLVRVFEKYPDAVRVCFKRLVENLESSEPGIVSATIGLFCELVPKNPRFYIPLAPEFYRILVDCKNNWALIKVLKILTELMPLEPRLGRKFIEPICEHIRSTAAISLLFECIRTVVTCLAEYEFAVKLAMAKNREFLMHADPNLRSLGLQALSIVAPKHLWAVLESKEIVVKSLNDQDPNIKLKSLQLLVAMVSQDNLAEICRVLVDHALKCDPEFCNEILHSILLTCSKNAYDIVIDFNWYVLLLREILRIPHCQKGEEIEKQLIDIAMRVKDFRSHLLCVCHDLLIDPALIGNPFIHRVLSAAAWVSGEYIEFSKDKDPFEIVEVLLHPQTTFLPSSVRAVYIQSSLKVVVYCLHSYIQEREDIEFSLTSEDLAFGVSNSFSSRVNQEDTGTTGEASSLFKQGEQLKPRFSSPSHEDLCSGNSKDSTQADDRKYLFDSIGDVGQKMNEHISNMLNVAELALSPLCESHDVEVQERAQNVLGLINLVKVEILGCLNQKGDESEGPRVSEITELMHDLFSKELGPVSASAQKHVPVPDGLILSDSLAELETICGDVQLSTVSSLSLEGLQHGKRSSESMHSFQSKEETEQSSGSTPLIADP